METLNLVQAAALLHLHPTTLLKRIKLGTIPAAKIGKRWVFLLVDLIDYLRSQYITQALQGDNEESLTCHSTREKSQSFGGSKSQSLDVSRYNALLEQPTNAKRRSTKRC